ncbi:MAG: PAS domain S-box-containing protein, partial [Glaciecola sp.]
LVQRGSLEAAFGVGVSLVMFAAYRTSVGAQQQRDRASRLRDVAMALVTASGSMEAFDGALGRVGSLFEARSCELLLVGGRHRHINVESGESESSEPSAAATAGLAFDSAETLAAGSELGGAQGALVAPILRDGVNVGSLVLHARRGLEPWAEADQDVLEGVASETLVALQNAELVEQLEDERAHLAEQSELLTGILSAASDGIALIAPDGEVLSWNPAMSIIAGTGDTHPVGQNLHDVLQADEDSGAVDPIDDAMQVASQGITLARTWRIRPLSGEERWVRVVLSPAAAGDRIGVVLMARDVTAVREVDRLKADFITTLSHELRTPLTPLKGFIELDQRQQLSPAQRVDMLASMHRQVTRLEGLVDDMLAMSELDRGMVDVAQEPIELRDAVQRVHRKHVDTGRVMPDSEAVTVIGDLEAVVRIVDALVDNALKHTDGAVQVSVGRNGNRGLVTVKDDGRGIAPSDLELIFERFSRLGDHLLRTQGPGLGLPIARALARRLGGDVRVISELERGASFELWLPLG